MRVWPLKGCWGELGLRGQFGLSWWVSVREVFQTLQCVKVFHRVLGIGKQLSLETVREGLGISEIRHMDPRTWPYGHPSCQKCVLVFNDNFRVLIIIIIIIIIVLQCRAIWGTECERINWICVLRLAVKDVNEVPARAPRRQQKVFNTNFGPLHPPPPKPNLFNPSATRGTYTLTSNLSIATEKTFVFDIVNATLWFVDFGADICNFDSEFWELWLATLSLKDNNALKPPNAWIFPYRQSSRADISNAGIYTIFRGLKGQMLASNAGIYSVFGQMLGFSEGWNAGIAYILNVLKLSSAGIYSAFCKLKTGIYTWWSFCAFLILSLTGACMWYLRVYILRTCLHVYMYASCYNI